MPSFDVDDTIVAVASATGVGMRGIIRLSGQSCLQCLLRAFHFDSPQIRQDVSELRQTTRLSARLPLETSEFSTDHALYLPGHLVIWPTKQSYTRQPSSEFHTFASPSLLSMGVKQICRMGARLAQPGEFTLRAFLSGRLDLPQAEAVLAVIDAQSPNQLDGALRQLAGGLSGPLSHARQQLLFILAELEAGLDFVEEDIEFISSDTILNKLGEIEQTLNQIHSQIKSRELSSPLIRVALIGLPNAGKSSLFNALLGTERAIVSHLSGTTTDFLAGQLDLDGLTVELLDTAGKEMIRSDQANHQVSQLAQQQREFVESRAQINLLCLDASLERSEWERSQIEKIFADPRSHSIIVMTHSDLLPDEKKSKVDFVDHLMPDSGGIQSLWVTTSLDEPSSMDRLKRLIKHQAIQMMESETEVVGSTLVRTADSLRTALAHVQAAQQAANQGLGEEIIAAEIRGSLEELGLVVGTVYTDDILDVVFSRFCIGK